ncbi:hypothetical protein [Bdellovibrio sp. HCB209]|uniref:hypothetical protein n=1 Tax=Bdellovibrio sp. HCB209 TaxID=3394354 RepID=UPI0039B3D9FE
MKTFLIFSALIPLLISCASKKYDSDFSSEYKSRPTLSLSLTTGSEPLTEAAIHKLLSSKVSLPKKIQLAIVRITDSKDALAFQTIDKEIGEKFYDKSNWGPRVRSVVPVPQVVVATPVTLSGLRQTSALLQADALLIIKPVSYSDWKFKWFAEDKAKAITSLEVLLLDTRTGVIPYTAIVTETAEIEDSKEDYSKSELTARAQKASENKALMQIGPGVKQFIAEVL